VSTICARLAAEAMRWFGLDNTRDGASAATDDATNERSIRLRDSIPLEFSRRR
jgi:hypothetical protein